MKNLTTEILLRLAKAGAAALLGALVFAGVIVLGAQPSLELGLLCWLAGAAFVLLVETSPI